MAAGFCYGPHRHIEKTSEVLIAPSPRALRNISGNRYRRPSQLARETILLGCRETRRLSIDIHHKVTRFLPDNELSKVSHKP